MAVPDELDSVLDPRVARVLMLEDGNLEPGPAGGEFVIAVALIVRLGDELEAVDPLDQFLFQRLRREGQTDQR